MAAKEGKSNNDVIRKSSKLIAWVLFVLFTLYLIYSFFETYDGGRLHISGLLKMINSVLKTL